MKRKEHFLFILAWYPVGGGGGGGGGAERIDFRERESNFSLDFQAFGPSVLVGARGEVCLRCKGYA